MDKPAILVTPRDFQVEPAEIMALADSLRDVQSGQVVSASFAVQIHHLIDGLWVESTDLPKVLAKAGGHGEPEYDVCPE